ncbi:DNA-binding protein HU-beta [Paramagnetospirillum magnetotacticum MS-1]|uniref:DNA-binding protein HU-beta n=1 Tax=Paramagnetospirillum magnetotacticum MS-1 TaxID=272627 RepID=A0A0C2U648_PARME|nr:HU family DNA-binding protein [Paramagnetospirillum magnetotacticum]KIL96927.1 DNA-binding protein HU-beta [Paramagnetospirillum magnetotacticum MS-1]
MSKTAISKAIRTATGCTVAQADEAVDAVIATILDGVKTEGRFGLIGFGTFSKSERPARQGRNPRTGKTIEIKASSTIKFKASSALKK